MKIMWLCNVILPQVSRALGKDISTCGGWLFDMAERLREHSDIDFYTCFASSDGNIYRGSIDGVTYRSFTQTDLYKSSKQNEIEFCGILKEIDPDIIHIFGTEYAHTLSMVRAAKECGMSDRVVISIQGLTSVIARHYYAGLPDKVIRRSTFRDFVRHDNIKQAKRKFEIRGKNEVEALRQVCHIIGRTDWDHACVSQINPNARYYKCNESLRNTFYEKKWELDNCEKHSIFVSQAGYPLKGFHNMLEAFSIIKKKYPDAKLYTTGKNNFERSLEERIRDQNYLKYIRSLIKKYGVEDSVFYLGGLNENQMCDRFLKSNVFVLCSSIENSPNSVGEAMMLGVPTVASDVGGVRSLFTDEQDGYIYPSDEPYMIAFYVDKLFSNRETVEKFSNQSRLHAAKTHDREQNFIDLMDIYNKIL